MNSKNIATTAIEQILSKHGVYQTIIGRLKKVLHHGFASVKMALQAEPNQVNKDYILLLLDGLLRTSANKPEVVDEEGFVPLDEVPVTEDIPDVPSIANHLAKYGVLETKGFGAGEESSQVRACRIIPNQETPVLKEGEVSSSTGIEIAVKYGLKEMIGAEQQPDLFKFYIEGDLDIDIPRATQILEDEFVAIDDRDEFTPVELIRNMNYWQYKVFELKSKRYQFKQDTLSGFLKTSLNDFVDFPALGTCITYNGEQLAHLEVVNNKFIMLIAVLNYDFWGFTPAFRDFLFHMSTQEGLQQTLPPADTLAAQAITFTDYMNALGLEIMYEPTPSDRDGKVSKDFRLKEISNGKTYLEAVYALPVTPSLAKSLIGLFSLKNRKSEHKAIARYTEVVSKLGMLNHLLKSQPFDDVRESMDNEEGYYDLPNMLFDKGYTRGDLNIIMRGTFYRKFPAISKFLEWLNLNDSHLLSNLLNRMEAHVLVERICKRVIAEIPGAPVFPVMTPTPSYSVLTTSAHSRSVSGIIANEIGRIAGHNVFIYTLPWDQESVG